MINKVIRIFFFLIIVTSCTNKNKNYKYVVNDNDTIYYEYYDNGNTKFISDIKYGKQNGRFMSFHDNGKMSAVGTIKEDKKNGVWKFYDEKEYLLSVKYLYDDSIEFILDKEDFLYREHVINKDNIKIRLPENWINNENYDNDKLVLTSKKNCSDNIIFCPNITVTKEIIGDANFGDFIKANIEILIQRFPDLKIVIENNNLINDLNAYQMVCLMRSNNLKFGGVITWIQVEDKVYIITGLAINEEKGEFLKYKGLFEEISNSFRI